MPHLEASVRVAREETCQHYVEELEGTLLAHSSRTPELVGETQVVERPHRARKVEDQPVIALQDATFESSCEGRSDTT